MRSFGQLHSKTLSIVVTCLLACAIAFTGWNLSRLQLAAAAVQEELVASVDEMLIGLKEGDMVAVEDAAMRLWRLSEINRRLTPMQPYARSLQQLATELTEIAAGWHSLPLSPELREGALLQLINLREMIDARDLTKSSAVLAFLQTP